MPTFGPAEYIGADNASIRTPTTASPLTGSMLVDAGSGQLGWAPGFTLDMDSIAEALGYTPADNAHVLHDTGDEVKTGTLQVAAGDAANCGLALGQANIGIYRTSGYDVAISRGGVTTAVFNDSMASFSGGGTFSGDLVLSSPLTGLYIRPSGVNKGTVYFGSNQNRLYGYSGTPWVVESDGGFKVRNEANNADGPFWAGAAIFSRPITVHQYASDEFIAGPEGVVIDANAGVGTYPLTVKSGGTLLMQTDYLGGWVVRGSGLTLRTRDNSARAPITAASIEFDATYEPFTSGLTGSNGHVGLSYRGATKAGCFGATTNAFGATQVALGSMNGNASMFVDSYLLPITDGMKVTKADRSTPGNLSAGDITVTYPKRLIIQSGGFVECYAGDQLAVAANNGAQFVVGNGQGATADYPSAGYIRVDGQLHPSYFTDLVIAGGGTYGNGQTAGHMRLMGGGVIGSETGVTAGHVFVHGGRGATNGNAVLAHTGSAVRGRVLIGTATDDGSNLLQVAGAAIFSGDIRQNPSTSVTPANNGELVVEKTSDTSITFKLKGSDGVVRTGLITLA